MRIQNSHNSVFVASTLVVSLMAWGCLLSSQLQPIANWARGAPATVCILLIVLCGIVLPLVWPTRPTTHHSDQAATGADRSVVRRVRWTLLALHPLCLFLFILLIVLRGAD